MTLLQSQKLEEMGEKSEGLKIVKELMAKFKLIS